MLIQKLLGTPGQEICTVYHWHSPQAPALVFCPGIANNMSEPRYLLSILARQCYKLGLNVFQFDYYGDGDSSGDHRNLSQQSIIASAEQVISFAKSLGCKRIGLVGYGAGNIVATLLTQRVELETVVLLSPHFFIFPADGQPVWDSFSQGPAQTIFPQIEDASTPLGNLWQATIGEAIVPAQPCGPITSSFLSELKAFSPKAVLSEFTEPLLVISERTEDAEFKLTSSSVFKRIEHTPEPYKPTWHWCVTCREEILKHISDWFQTQFALADHSPTSLGDASDSVQTNLNIGEDYQPGQNSRQCALTIQSQGQSLLGILHIPSVAVPLRRILILYEQGIPGQRVDIHRCGPRLAERLTQQGFYVFRYDGRGMGVSEGEFHDFTWTRKLEDTLEVIKHLKAVDPTNIRAFIMFGNSAGARAACMAANRSSEVLGAVLWGPIMVEPQQRVGGGVVKRHPTGGLVTEYCGLWLGIKYNLDERAYDFLNELEVCRKPCLIVFANEEENLANRQMVELIASRQPEKDVLEFPGTHGFAPEHIERVIGATSDWLANITDSIELI